MADTTRQKERRRQQDPKRLKSKLEGIGRVNRELKKFLIDEQDTRRQLEQITKSHTTLMEEIRVGESVLERLVNEIDLNQIDFGDLCTAADVEHASIVLIVDLNIYMVHLHETKIGLLIKRLPEPSEGASLRVEMANGMTSGTYAFWAPNPRDLLINKHEKPTREVLAYRQERVHNLLKGMVEFHTLECLFMGDLNYEHVLGAPPHFRMRVPEQSLEDFMVIFGITWPLELVLTLAP